MIEVVLFFQNKMDRFENIRLLRCTETWISRQTSTTRLIFMCIYILINDKCIQRQLKIALFDTA